LIVVNTPVVDSVVAGVTGNGTAGLLTNIVVPRKLGTRPAGAATNKTANAATITSSAAANLYARLPFFGALLLLGALTGLGKSVAVSSIVHRV